MYFIRSENGGPIKIGYSRDPEGRCDQLQTGHPYRLRVIARLPGDRALEHQLHVRFSTIRLCNEWFDSSPELLTFVQEIQQ